MFSGASHRLQSSRAITATTGEEWLLLICRGDVQGVCVVEEWLQPWERSCFSSAAIVKVGDCNYRGGVATPDLRLQLWGRGGCSGSTKGMCRVWVKFYRWSNCKEGISGTGGMNAHKFYELWVMIYGNCEF